MHVRPARTNLMAIPSVRVRSEACFRLKPALVLMAVEGCTVTDESSSCSD